MKKLFILLIFVACTPSHNEELHKQSIEMHEAALKAGKLANDKISQFAAEVETRSDSVLLDSVASLKQGYEEWEASIVEVPGHEHDHHDHAGHDHNHDHSPRSGSYPGDGIGNSDGVENKSREAERESR